MTKAAREPPPSAVRTKKDTPTGALSSATPNATDDSKTQLSSLSKPQSESEKPSSRGARRRVPLFAVLAVLVPAVAIAILSAGDLSFLAGIEYMPAQQFLTTGSPAFDVDACISLSVFACASARFSSHAGATRTPAAKHCQWLFIQWFHISFPLLILIG
jgi:hypothetical protein